MQAARMALEIAACGDFRKSISRKNRIHGIALPGSYLNNDGARWFQMAAGTGCYLSISVEAIDTSI